MTAIHFARVGLRGYEGLRSRAIEDPEGGVTDLGLAAERD